MLSDRSKRGLGFLLLAATMLVSSAASAETFTFYVQKTYPATISLSFQSTTRDHAWPGGSKTYVMRDDQKYRFYLSCNSGEQICFGAWVQNNPKIYWGVGQDQKKYGCERCCYTCDGGFTKMIVLQQ